VIHYELAGDGPAVVLLHSSVADSRMWDSLVEALAPSHRVVRYDRRGFGRSPLPGGPYSDLVDLVELLEGLGIDRAAVVASSAGGGLAVDFALADPERVQRLVLAAPALGGWDWSDEVRAFGAAEEEALDAGDVETATELNLRTWVDPGQASPQARDLVRDMQRTAFEIQLAAYEESPPPDPQPAPGEPAFERLEELFTPTLVAVGDRDVADFRAIADCIAVRAREARLVVFAGAAHLIPLERPDDFNRLVLDFI
jgi:3-oxoadipate enol-lactonase